VLPLVSTGGIKNKLLEAAAMGSAIVCTRKACSGLLSLPPATIVDHEREWVEAMLQLWRTPVERQRLGAEARTWAIARHSWKTAAENALRALNQG
jgi:glycosyltransferase involved in cell wall biosynthesis